VGVLDILPEGRTNISLGLSAGLQQIQKSGVDERFGILLTDGWQNVGRNPIETAARFPRLHVISLPGGNPELSRRIARAGKGHFIPLRQMTDVSKAILRCLI
jgi:Mg-chelatase subunit ChlD